MRQMQCRGDAEHRMEGERMVVQRGEGAMGRGLKLTTIAVLTRLREETEPDKLSDAEVGCRGINQGTPMQMRCARDKRSCENAEDLSYQRDAEEDQ